MDASRTTTALLIDDDPASLRNHQQRLVNQGYAVVVAQNASDGLSRAKQSAPKVIFVHLVAAGPGGLSLIQALRSDDSCRHVPIVVLHDHQDARVAKTHLRAVHRERW